MASVNYKNIKSYLLCTLLAIINQGLFRDKISSTKINSTDQTTEDNKTPSSNIVLHKDRQKKFEADSKKTPSLGKMPEILYAVLTEIIIFEFLIIAEGLNYPTFQLQVMIKDSK